MTLQEFIEEARALGISPHMHLEIKNGQMTVPLRGVVNAVAVDGRPIGLIIPKLPEDGK